MNLLTKNTLTNNYIILAITIFFAYVGSMFSSVATIAVFPAFVQIILFFGIFYLLSYFINKTQHNQPLLSFSLLNILTAFLGFTTGPLIQYALSLPDNMGMNIIAISFGLTLIILIFMSIIAYFNKDKRLSVLQNITTIGFAVASISMILSWFVAIDGFSLVVSGIFVVVSSLSLVIQAQNIMNRNETETASQSPIGNVLIMFTNIYNIFTGLLRIILSYSDD